VTRHDIKNQLITLQGFTQHAMTMERDPAIAGYLAKVDTSATRIRGQIEFMKAYQELGVNSPAWFRLDEIVGKTALKEIPCSCSCPGIEVFSDPMLEKVFSNLFDNALRHGGHVREISVRCEEPGDGLLFVVAEDNGVGIPDEEKEKIFDKGYGKNTGFGLFLVREILSITGITIRETGIFGKGARFEIRVPKECWRRTAS
jgi:signal transduction histidine kinase